MAHEGWKELVVIDEATLSSADFGELTVRLTDEIQANVLDSEEVMVHAKLQYDK